MDGKNEMVSTTTIEDSPEELAFDVPLVFDDLRAGQLGSSEFRNTKSELSTPRSLIAENELRHFYFQVRYHKARYGTFEGNPACLVVFNLSFQKSGSSNSRFKSAEVDVEFEDAVVRKDDDDDDEQEGGEDEDEILGHQPRILSFQPQEYYGPVRSAEGFSAVQASISLSPPGGVASVTPSISKQTPFVKEGFFKAHGVLRDNPPSRLHLTFEENELTSGGIRPEVSIPLIVSYTPRRRFAVRIRVRADLFLRLLRPVCGEKDDPVYFDPDVMIKKSKNKPSADEGADDEKLDGIDLKPLTRLGFHGGVFM